MKAVLCKAYGPPSGLVVEDVPALKAGPGQVVVGVKAAGVNFPDGLIIGGTYQVKPPLPFTPGLEVSGVVKEVGEGVTGLKPGMRVVSFPAAGGFAEELLVKASLVFPMPDNMSFPDGGGFLVTYATSHHALKDRGHLQPGETLLVLGAAGGVGLAAVDIAKAMGARVIAVASTDEKLALCKQYGADETINYTNEELRPRIKRLTDGKGVDVVYDPVGGSYAEAAVRSLAWEGRYLVIGFASGEIPKIALNLLLLKSSSIVGVYWGESLKVDPAHAAKNLDELFAWYSAGKLKPHISAQYPLSRAAEALDDVMSRRTMGKVVLVTE